MRHLRKKIDKMQMGILLIDEFLSEALSIQSVVSYGAYVWPQVLSMCRNSDLRKNDLKVLGN